jgi:DNA-binding LytR/AlgR family response regulator
MLAHHFPTIAASARGTDRFMIKADGGFVFVPYAEVHWIEAQGDYVKFHAGPRSCLVRLTMKTLQSTLDAAHFLRVHRSAAVNIDQIEKVMLVGPRAYGVVLRNGTRVRISAAHLASLRKFYQASLGLADEAHAQPADPSAARHSTQKSDVQPVDCSA